MNPLYVSLPIRTVNTSNVREHWATRAKRAKSHRSSACMAVRVLAVARGMWAHLAGGGRLQVRLTRVGPRELDDDGNVTSLKAVKDGVADALGLKSDKDPRIDWIYNQYKGGVRFYAVGVTITEFP